MNADTPEHPSNEQSASSSPEKRWTLTLQPKNSDLAFVFFGCLFYYMVRVTGFPFSPVLLEAFVMKGIQLMIAVMTLSIPVIVAKALAFGYRSGFRTLKTLPPWLTLVQPYWTLEFVSVTIRRIIVILGAIYLFLHLKHLVLWWHKANFDLFFWNLDRKIHFGVQPNVWAMNTFGPNHDVAILLDWLYIKYFTYKLIVAVVFLMEPRGRKLSDQFFLAYQLVWFLGGLGYLVMPADGPAYAVLSEFSIPKDNQFHMFQYPIVTDAPPEYVKNYQEAKIYYAKVYQEKLWVDRQSFLNGTELPGVFYGIAAMPSLHVAAVTMIMIFLMRASVVAGLFGIVYVVTTFLGSILLQWHYAIDGYVGATMAALVCLVSMKTPELWPLIFCRRKRSASGKP